VLASFPSRRLRLPATWLIAVALAACAPAADPARNVTSEPIAAAPTVPAAIAAAPTTSAAPGPSASGAPTASPGPGGDSVTGGEFGTSASSAPASASAPPAVAEARPTATPRPAAAAAKPFALNLYRKGDFVAQYTFEWCVGASLQMALNMSTTGSHRSRADQQELWEMARDRSFSPFGGANPRGWTAVLNELGVGPYELVSIPTLDEALTTAAEAIRATKRPVGLVMWRGRHAWVMSGFESTADPAKADDFDVTGVRVLDPLYPHGSSVWGKSPRPNSLVSPATLAKQFIVRDVTRSRVNLGVPTGYLMILPVDAA
jgi:hypothetical protein